ncbi:MAG: lipoyl synthase, partial [Candidatus Muiribacteriota bacterium]
SEAQCPNQFECYSKGTATFLIMGDKCTRNCRFCSIGDYPDEPPDYDEPAKVAEAAKKMGLNYVVVTSVTRDDLDDGGASLFADVIVKLREKISDVKTEVLIPDFKCDEKALNKVLDAKPEVLNHNVETVKSLYSEVRPQADYQRSLDVLTYCKKRNPEILVKSGLMAGLGETLDELKTTIKDIKDAGADFLTIGQYLQPTKDHLSVKNFVTPEEFEELKRFALETGFKDAACGPFVRSSYKAGEMYENK